MDTIKIEELNRERLGLFFDYLAMTLNVEH